MRNPFVARSWQPFSRTTFVAPNPRRVLPDVIELVAHGSSSHASCPDALAAEIWKESAGFALATSGALGVDRHAALEFARNGDGRRCRSRRKAARLIAAQWEGARDVQRCRCETDQGCLCEVRSTVERFGTLDVALDGAGVRDRAASLRVCHA